MGIRLGRASHDEARGWFEARVDVDRDGRTFRDPARVQGPANAPRPWVEAAPADHAPRMSDSGRPRPFWGPAARAPRPWPAERRRRVPSRGRAASNRR